MPLLYEATYLDIPLDLNTYIKILSQVYFDLDESLRFERKSFINCLYTMFNNDHMGDDF